jgi:uncharacterized protein DUF3592
MPTITLIIILSVVLPVLLVAITIFFVLRFSLGLMRESRQRQALLRNGERAVAEILSISDTGVTVNDSPRVALHLFVRPKSRTGFEANTKLLVSRLSLAAFQPGAKIQVRFDPNDLQRVAVEPPATNFQPGAVPSLAASRDLAAQATRATALVLSAKEGEPAGRLRLMDLLLEVRVTDRPPYQINTRVAVAPENDFLVKPGAQINATVSSSDPTRISLELPATG